MTKARLAGVLLAAISIVATQVQTAWAAPPSNDLFENAVVVSALPAVVEADTTEATMTSDGPNCYPATRNVWYSYTPTADETLIWASTHDNFDVVLGVFGDAETPPRCSFEPVTFDAKKGVTYHLLVSNYGERVGGQATVQLKRITPPRNDDIKTARPVHSMPFNIQQTNLGATGVSSDPDCFGNNNSVWFTIMAEESQELIASTLNSRYNTAMGIYEGSRGDLREISCTDSTGKSSNVRRTFKAHEGNRYFIMVVSQKGVGQLDFSLQPRLKVVASITPKGFAHDVTGVARVGGTFVCTGDSKVRIYGELRQAHGSDVTSASFRTPWIRCTGKPKTWHALASEAHQAFTAGAAGLAVRAYASAGKESAKDKAGSIVTLKECRCDWGS